MIDGDSVLSYHAKERKIRRIITVLGSQPGFRQAAYLWNITLKLFFSYLRFKSTALMRKTASTYTSTKAQ